MGEMRDSDWSRPNLLRSDWLPIHVAIMTTSAVNGDTYNTVTMKDIHIDGSGHGRQQRQG